MNRFSHDLLNDYERCLYNLCVDIQEFYVHTLGDDYKPGYQKAEETLKLANQWEGSNPPIPSTTVQNGHQQASTEQEDCVKVTVG